MAVTRAIATCLIALFITAIWGVMIHFGTLALGVPIGDVWLVAVLTLIFLVLAWTLSIASMVSEGSRDDELDPDA